MRVIVFFALAVFAGSTMAQTKQTQDAIKACLEQASAIGEGYLKTDDGKKIKILAMKDPPVSQTHDCRTNAAMFPFIDIDNPDMHGVGIEPGEKIGVWMLGNQVQAMLTGNGWQKRGPDRRQTNVDDLIIHRTNGQIDDVLVVKEVYPPTSTSGNRPQIIGQFKSDTGLVQTFSGVFPDDNTLEVWTPGPGKSRTR